MCVCVCVREVHCNRNKNTCFIFNWTLKRQTQLHCSTRFLHWTIYTYYYMHAFALIFRSLAFSTAINFCQINCYYRIAKTFIVKIKTNEKKGKRTKRTEDEQAHTNITQCVHMNNNNHNNNHRRMKEIHLFFSHASSMW